MKKNTLLKNKGMTLLELTVVILVLLTLMGALFFGAKAYKQGADRAACILNIRNMQQALRSYCNMNQIPTPTDAADAKNIADIKDQIIGDTNAFMETPTCPGTGLATSYTTADTVPVIGVVWAECDYSGGGNDHSPAYSAHQQW